MKAVIQREFGGPNVLRTEDVETAACGSHDVVVQVHAVTVNPGLDFEVREGRYPRPVTLPHVLGLDPSGIVLDVGKDVLDRRAGDRVWVSYLVGCGTCVQCRSGRAVACADNRMIGVNRWGGYAENVVVPAANTIPVPDQLDFADASVLARHMPTAMFLIEERAQLMAGEWILVTGATGGLGHACVQIARAVGGKVIALAGSDERVEAALKAGATCAINRHRDDLEQQIMSATEGEGLHVLCDNVAEPGVWEKALRCMRKNGRVVTSGSRAGDFVRLDVKLLYTRRISIIAGPGTVANGASRAFDMALAGQISPVPYQVRPAYEAAEVHAAIERHEVEGKFVLDPRP